MVLRITPMDLAYLPKVITCLDKALVFLDMLILNSKSSGGPPC